MMKITEPCGHVDPNDHGQTDSALHGVCIFCYRDRGAAFEKRIEELEQRIEDMKSAFAVTRNSQKFRQNKIKELEAKLEKSRKRT